MNTDEATLQASSTDVKPDGTNAQTSDVDVQPDDANAHAGDTDVQTGDTDVQTGDTVFLTVRGYPTPAVVLAILDGEMLIEYEIGSYSAMRIVPAGQPDSPTYRHVSYHHCPRKWLAAVAGAGLDWIGAARGSERRAPSPLELLATAGDTPSADGDIPSADGDIPSADGDAPSDGEPAP